MERLGAYRVNVRCLAVLLPMELVHQPVHYGRKDKACCDQEHQAGVERIQTSEHLTSVGSGRVHRPHSAHKHCRIQERVAPRELLEVLVPRHTQQERKKEKSERGCGMEQHAPDEVRARDRWVYFWLVHGGQSERS